MARFDFRPLIAAATLMVAVFSTAAQAQTVTLDGASYPSLAAAVNAANTAGSGTIDLSAGTFNLTRTLYIDGNIDVVGAPLDPSGKPTSIITYDDGQTFELSTIQGNASYLITVSNVLHPNVAVNFKNIEVDAGSPSLGCTIGGGASSPCVLGGFNYVEGNVPSGFVQGTLTNSAAIGGKIGLVINSKHAAPHHCIVTVDGFTTSGHTWGAGVNISANGRLVLGDGGITTQDSKAAYGDDETAEVQFPDGSIHRLLSGSVLYTVVFDANGGQFSGGSSSKSIGAISSKETTLPSNPPTRAGYTFTGWYTDKAATIKYDVSKPATANAVAFAGWLLKESTVSAVPATGNMALAMLGLLLAGVAAGALRRRGT
ncbi:MAG: InlB B-repeat-containing protein [Burkholderiaceae bacterium]|jgi:uncharacterized repeat protein (TIGR02543 family)|nr:InlB B-repeat-containing protein [Burkholderiaceae bacterium]